jgi:hypothetical protein
MRPRFLPWLLAAGYLVACHVAPADNADNERRAELPVPARDELASKDMAAPAALQAVGQTAAEATRTDNGSGGGSWYSRGASDPSGLATMIIRTGQASVEVDSLAPAIATLRTLAGRLGGYLANTSYQGGREQHPSASIEIKVPSDRFDDLLSGLSPLGRLEYANVTSQDVGEEYADIDARVTNAKRLEQRLIELLANRPGKLQEILELERELARVREEIERYEGRMRYLRSHASLSSLTISVHEPVILQAGSETARVLNLALERAWRNFVQLNANLIAMLGVLLPVTLALLAGVAVVRRWWRNRNLRLA